MSKLNWGPWRLDLDQCLLYLEHEQYEVSLVECDSKENILGWIAHMADKLWMDDAKLAGLARALNDLFNPHFTSRIQRTEQEIRDRVRRLAADDDAIGAYCQPRPYIWANRGGDAS